MCFKNRKINNLKMVEESFSSIANTIKTSPSISAVVGGAGAGALYNYLSDGASDELSSDINNTQDWINTDAREELLNKSLIDKDDFTNARDHFIKGDFDKRIGSILPNPSRYILGTTEDMDLGLSTDDHMNKLRIMASSRPELNISTDGDLPNIDMSIGGYQVKPYSGSDSDYNSYVSGKELNSVRLTPDQIKAQIYADPELKAEFLSQKAGALNANRDSYLKNMALGAGVLGAGQVASSFAARKLKHP